MELAYIDEHPSPRIDDDRLSPRLALLVVLADLQAEGVVRESVTTKGRAREGSWIGRLG